MIYLSERRCTVRNNLQKCIRILWHLGGDRPRIIFNLFPVSSYCPCFLWTSCICPSLWWLVGFVPIYDWSVLSQSLIGRFCPCLLLVGSVPVYDWSVLYQSLIGRFCPSLLLVGSVPVSYWSVLSQSLIGQFCPSLLLVGSVPVYDWSVVFPASDWSVLTRNFLRLAEMSSPSAFTGTL